MDKMIIGFSTDRYLLVDLDNITEVKAEGLAMLMIKNYGLIDCLVMKSSGTKRVKELSFNNGQWIPRHDEDGSYHLIFGDRLWYQYICYILDQLNGLGVVSEDYVRIRDWRGDLTLRVSADNSADAYRPPPEPVIYITRKHTPAEHGEGVEAYMQFYEAVNGHKPRAIKVTRLWKLPPSKSI